MFTKEIYFIDYYKMEKKLYYLKNRDQKLEYGKEYYMKNKIKVKERNDKNKYQISQYNRQYYQNHKIEKPIILKTKEKVKRIIDDNVRLLFFD